MRKNPFGDDFDAGARRRNPFEDEEESVDAAMAAQKVEMSARKIRNLRAQIGAEGLTLPATRELIDEIATALEAAARAIRGLDTRN